MLRQAALWLVLVGGTVGSIWVFAPADEATAARRGVQVRQPELLGQIAHYQRATWRWQRVMGTRLTRSAGSALRIHKPSYRRWVRDLWRDRAAVMRRRAQRPPHKAAWRCLYLHERSPSMGWKTRTGNGYYGGLQMDWSFMRTYGAWLLRTKGTADRWTALEQMWVGEKALRAGRGFYPWPNSARACGLI
jgi:hypothetical protein